MKVWVLFSDDYYKNIEGIYTEEGKALKESQLLDDAIKRRATVNEKLMAEIVELKELRQPYIIEADILLEAENAAKEAGATGKLKDARKQRKMLLRQAEHITYDIRYREEKILASNRMTRAEILSNYGRDCYWEDHYLEGDTPVANASSYVKIDDCEIYNL
jgi:hypothetical protein